MVRASAWGMAVGLVGSLALAGCGANYAASSNLPPAPTSGGAGGAGGTGGTSGSASCGTDTWNNYAAAFFANSCESCHQHTTEFSTEAAVLAKASTIETYVNGGLMPQGAPLAQADRDRLAAWFGCPDGTTSVTTTGGGTGSGTTSSSSGSTTGSCSSFTWADVQPIFASYCTSCHSAGGSASAYVDLTSQSAATADAANIYGYVNAGLMPKPGSPQLPVSDKSTVLAWAGNPSGVCGGSSGSSGTTGTPPGPGSLGPVTNCGVQQTDGSATWSGDGSSNMLPGQNCLQCHAVGSGNDREFVFAGTLYTTSTSTNPQYPGTVSVVDATGATASVSTHSSGNFYCDSWNCPVNIPLSVTVSDSAGHSNWMLHQVTVGSCNACHTQSGQCAAPGHIYVQP